MALIKLTPKNIIDNWDTIKPFIFGALPPHLKDAKESGILNAMTSQQLQCWAFEKDGQVITILTTAANYDPFVGARSLVIYTIASIGGMADVDWAEALVLIKKFGISQNCPVLSGYTDKQRFIKIAKNLGANTEIRLVTFPIEGG